MRRTCLAAAAALLMVVPAGADELGGDGFAVPQDGWLFGIEGLQRTPVDMSLDMGVTFIGYEIQGQGIHQDDVADGAGRRVRTSDMDIEPTAFEGGFRAAGGIGYWACCVMIEPALSFRMNRPFGDDRTDDTPILPDPDDTDNSFAELELKPGWDLGLGFQMTYMIKEDTPLLGGWLAGQPLVFFPYLGVSHVEYDVELTVREPDGTRDDRGIFDKSFEDDMFMVGFDLDIPLPGSHRDFTHALTFGFRWVDSHEQHDLGPFAQDQINGGTVLPPLSGATSCATAAGVSDDALCYTFEDQDGWRIGLYYRVTWNDFSGFFRRNIFGPVD